MHSVEIVQLTACTSFLVVNHIACIQSFPIRTYPLLDGRIQEQAALLLPVPKPATW